MENFILHPFTLYPNLYSPLREIPKYVLTWQQNVY